MALSFLSSVFTVAGGTALAQAIGLASLPFITRLYAPDIYGAYVLLLAYAGVLAPVVCARFEVALPLPRRDASAAALAWGALAVAALVSLLSACVVAGLIAAGLVAPAFAYLPVYVMLAGVPSHAVVGPPHFLAITATATKTRKEEVVVSRQFSA